MKRQYHLPDDADGAHALSDSLSGQTGRQLVATVLAGVARGVRRAAPDEAGVLAGHRAGVPLYAAGSPPAGPAAGGGPAHGGAGPAAPGNRKDGARAADRDRRKPSAAAPPRTRVFTYPGQSKWRLLYPAAVTKEQVESWLFAGGGLPDGFSLTADPSGGGAPGTAWYLSWADFRSRHPMGTVDFTTTLVNLLTPYGQGLVNRALVGGDATDEEVAAWRAGQQESKRRWQEYDRQFVPALKMTRGEAIARLPAGPYEVNGQFVWIGFKESLGRSIVETYPLSSNETFNRDVRHYLRHGLSVSQAVAAFTAQWDEILAIEMAFAGTGAGYRTPGAAEASETAGLQNETSLVERRLARAQGLLTEGDIALSKAASAAESTVIRTELTQLDELTGQTARTEITTVRPAETGVPAAPVSRPAEPSRRIGFVQPSTTPSDTAGTPSTGYKPVTGFGRDRTTLPVQPLDTGPSEQQTHTQMPPARQVSSASRGSDAAPGAVTGQRRGQPTTATAGKRQGADTPVQAPPEPTVPATSKPLKAPEKPKAVRTPKAPFDATARRVGAERVERVERAAVDAKASVSKQNRDRAAALQELKAQAATRPPKPASLRARLDSINGLKGYDDKAAAVAALRQDPGLTTEEKAYLDWLGRNYALQHESREAQGTVAALEGVQDTLATTGDAAGKALREASKPLGELLRSDGPNYRAAGRINTDQAMSPTAWDAQAVKPELATDHLVSVDAIGKLDEIRRLEALYEQAPAEVREALRAGLEDIGDLQVNLVRMRADANGSSLKSNRSWADISYAEAERFGYTRADVDAIRQRERRALDEIREAIEALIARYSGNKGRGGR